ncbi:MAG: 50S ribosomal protein L11 methyltransferase [Tannerellaceae bacterium]|jgi:ribosomal protein L11 methyltransferase|nr:50S ribosomal protein L11 methyltransferase [Tannerellaceae bacterium]
MNYYEYTFTHTSAIEPGVVNDVLTAVLGEAGFESFAETPQGLVLAYIQEKEDDAGRLDRALGSFPLEGVSIRYTKTLIEARDWNEEWEKNYFHPVSIGRSCLIHASFHTVDNAVEYDYRIVIDPRMAFGTGNHETTHLMLVEALKLDVAGRAVLDMGCGTAVLAILAAMKGASPVVAVDIDEWACNNALENIRLNRVGGIDVIPGGADRIPPALMFDVVFANINRNILLRDMPRYVRCMKPGATLLMSGFYVRDLPFIEEECSRNALTVTASSDMNDWMVVKAAKLPIYK